MMDCDLDYFRRLEADMFDALDRAVAIGLGTKAGRKACCEGLELLDRLAATREDALFVPLAADPLTRDYVCHLDAQIGGLAARIDILRAHVELGLHAQPSAAADIDRSLARLVRQLRARFRREAALLPVYAGWCDRQDGADRTAALRG